MGLDPGLGVLHADKRARDSLALDVREAVRPTVDQVALDLIRNRTFRAADFVETRQGACRIIPPLTHELAATVSIWENELAGVVERVAQMLVVAPESRVTRLPTLLTGRNRSAGRDHLRRGDRPRQQASVIVGAVCRTCGTSDLPAGRRYCDRCLPDRRADQKAEFVAQSGDRLRRRRALGKRPGLSETNNRKRGHAIEARSKELSEWEREHGVTLSDAAAFRSDVLPGLRGLTVRKLATATGLSTSYCLLRGNPTGRQGAPSAVVGRAASMSR